MQNHLLSISNSLQRQGDLAQNKEHASLFKVAVNALKILANNYSEIQNSCILCQDLLKEIVAETEKISGKIEDYTDDVQALAFRIVDAASPVLKEAVLNKTIAHTDEVKLIKIFYEESGNWDKNDNTTTTQIYHKM